jgi:hypothetical protein
VKPLRLIYETRLVVLSGRRLSEQVRVIKSDRFLIMLTRVLLSLTLCLPELRSEVFRHKIVACELRIIRNMPQIWSR